MNYPYLNNIREHVLWGSCDPRHYNIFASWIEFYNVSVKDQGTYKISCQNELGEGSASFVLDITPNGMYIQWNGRIIVDTIIDLVAPVYKVTPNPVKAEAGKSVSVHFSLVNEGQCGIISQHSLRKKGIENITTPYEILDNEIVFLGVAVKDRGTYTISGRNEVGEGSASFVLDVNPTKGS